MLFNCLLWSQLMTVNSDVVPRCRGVRLKVRAADKYNSKKKKQNSKKHKRQHCEMPCYASLRQEETRVPLVFHYKYKASFSLVGQQLMVR